LLAFFINRSPISRVSPLHNQLQIGKPAMRPLLPRHLMIAELSLSTMFVASRASSPRKQVKYFRE
jgi:hypothetical protein